jgi:serine/threonine protein kinase
VIAGRYSLEQEIGRGGMGAVWLGTDDVLGRPVALKRVGFGPNGASPDLERAEREARLAARLNHPHVVAVYDLVTDAEERWLVMEYVPGVTLAALVRSEGALPADRAAPIIAQAADALAAAHAAGIVHRDVKPSNMLVAADGQVKLSDFGIARANADASLTQTGLVTGSPAYLAPEVASGQQATEASDIWALGATLFHALAGHPPYEVGDNVLGALYRIVHEEPPRLQDAGWLDPLLRATMATDPARRWTAAQVRDYLGRGPGGELPVPPPAAVPDAQVAPLPVESPGDPTVTTPPVAPSAPRQARRRTAVLPMLVGVVLLALLALIGWQVLRDDSPGEAGRDRPSPSTSSTADTPTETVTPDGMRTFVEDYLATVTSDPAATWKQLTPDFQDDSGGFEKYSKFWGAITSAEVVDADADPDTMQVSYSVQYVHRDGRKSSDHVTLVLEGRDGDYLIAGES